MVTDGLDNERDRADADAPGRCALIAFTRRGCALAKVLAAGLAQAGAASGDITVHGPARFADELGIQAYESLGAWTAARFADADALVYVGATGIAVRAIAPHVRDKLVDPAVVSIDEAGQFAVPLLSGHVGGANELARAVAKTTGGVAVVSTATDVNGLFAVDEWATRHGFSIGERAIAKEISARLLEGKPVGFATDIALDWQPPAGVTAVDMDASAECGGDGDESTRPAVGFAVSLDDTCQPFERTLHLVPQVLTVGVGCRKGVDASVLADAVDAALSRVGASPRAVGLLASIDVKCDEPAIRALASRSGWQTRFYTAEELNSVPGDFASSEFVRRTVGVDNVCERAALAEGGTLLLGKQPHDGTTVAIAQVKDIWM